MSPEKIEVHFVSYNMDPTRPGKLAFPPFMGALAIHRMVQPETVFHHQHFVKNSFGG